MDYLLQKNKIVVGECIVLSPTNVVYHLFDNIRETNYTTLEKIQKKYKLIEVEKGK